MLKLRLNFEDLQVDSFATGDGRNGRGTVQANSVYVGPTDINGTCPDTGGCGSCYNTCVQIGGACGSENQTYNESCVDGGCPNSWDQMCETDGNHGCYQPITV